MVEYVGLYIAKQTMHITTKSDTVTVTDEQIITDALTADVEESKKIDKSIEQRAPQPEKYTIFQGGSRCCR